MKENRIEEAIKIMEHWIEYEKNNKEKINRADELINIQKTILSDYKRVLKENEQLRTEVNSLKEIEQQHKTDNGLLRQELDMQIEHNKELEATLKQTQDSWFEDTQKLEQEKEKNKKLYEQNQLDIANADIVEKDKIIKLMTKYIADDDTTEMFCIDDENKICDDEECKKCVIRFFEEKVRN